MDEPSINIATKKAWVHLTSTPLYTRCSLQQKSNLEALTEMSILPNSQSCFGYTY